MNTAPSNKTIVVLNQKGGVGKTTTTIHLGHALALLGKTTLLVDADPQGHVATALGLELTSDQRDGLYNLLVKEQPLGEVVLPAGEGSLPRDNLFILPGSKRSATAQVLLSSQQYNIHALKQALRESAQYFDYVLIDTNPSVGILQESAVMAANWAVIPTLPDYLSRESIREVVSTIAAVNDRGGSCHLFAVLVTMFDRVTRESREIYAGLQAEPSIGAITRPPIRRATILRDCAARGITLFEAEPTHEIANEFRTLAMEVIDATRERKATGAA